jgi:hypothetical protein
MTMIRVVVDILFSPSDIVCRRGLRERISMMSTRGSPWSNVPAIADREIRAEPRLIRSSVRVAKLRSDFVASARRR